MHANDSPRVEKKPKYFHSIYFRRMFPTLKVKIAGLEDEVNYDVGIEIRSVDCKRYRYVYHR